MPAPPSSTLVRLVARVRRRLFLQTLGRTLNLLCPVLLVLAALVIASLGRGHLRSQPWSLESEPFLTRLTWLTGAMALGLLLGGTLAWLRRPSTTSAALSVDESFDLKERVSTSLALDPDTAASPAGQALLADTHKQIEKIAVADAFPLRPSRRTFFLPLSLLLAVLASLFCDTLPSPAEVPPDPVAPELKAELDRVSKALQELAKQKPPAGTEKARKGESFKELAEEMARLGERQPGTNEEARELLKDMTSLEERLQRQNKSLAERAEAMRKQAEEADRLSKKKKPQPGQEKPAEQALTRGDLRKAADELQRLTKQIEDEKLSPEQMQQMEKEMQDLKEQLDRLADVKEKESKTGEGKEGEKLDPEELQQMKELDEAEIAELRELAKELEEVEKALKEGKKGEAAEKLAKAAEKLGKLDPGDKQEEAARRLAQLQALKQRLGRQLGGNPQQASGKRPEKPEEDIKGKETKAKGDRSEGGISGFRFQPGAGLKEPRSPEQVRPLIDEARREAAEALIRQRVPRGDADLTRGYFEKLRGPEPDRK